MSDGSRNVQFRYGLRDNKIVDVYDLTLEDKGKACNCKCPGCSNELIARLGKKKQWHFAHAGEECNLQVAQQTALHMLAKEIIEDHKCLLFPGITVKREDFISNIEDYRLYAKLPNVLWFRENSIVNCDSVCLEKKISNIIPDIVITAKGKKCLVEIAVTHFVDQVKEEKIREIGIPLLEIDLSDVYEKGYTRQQLVDEVLYNPNNRKWIYNPRYTDAEKWAEERYSELIRLAEKDIEQEDYRESVELERKQKRKRIGEERIKEIFQPDKYKKAILALKNDVETIKCLKQLKLKTNIDELPFFLNIPITGEMVFACDRRIWQSVVFEKFIYNRKTKDNNELTIHIERIKSWLEKYNDNFSINWDLAYKTTVCINGKEKTISLLWDVINTYIGYLSFLGFLSPILLQSATVKRTHSLIPPNKENADVLYDALKKVDWYEPNIDDLLIVYTSERKKDHNYSYIRTEVINETLNERQIASQASNKDRCKEFEQERVSGFEEVKDKDFDSIEPVYDSLECRWLKCTNCEKLFRSDQMACYGGIGKTNKGVCRNCSKR